jgi:hypothetical protein
MKNIIYKTMTYKEIREINLQCVQLKSKLMELGLFQTAHAMDEVTKKIGWETAEVIDGNHPVKLNVD